MKTRLILASCLILTFLTACQSITPTPTTSTEASIPFSNDVVVSFIIGASDGMHGIRIFPVLVRGEPVEAIPIELINAQRVDVRNEANFSPQMQKLVLALLGKPVVSKGIPTHSGPGHASAQPLPSKPGKKPVLLFVFMIGACLLFATALSLLFGSEIMKRLANIAPTQPFSLTDATPGENVVLTEPPASDGTACIVTITNPFVPLMSMPDPASRQLVQVPAGAYAMLDYALGTFAGQEQGWFKIEAKGRTGWVEDNIIFIDDKTSACP